MIQGAKGECIGVKRGEYQINGAILNDCLDHSISVGEHASLRETKFLLIIMLVENMEMHGITKELV